MNDVTERVIGETTIADKRYLANAGEAALFDFEGEIDTILRQLDYLWLDTDGEATTTAIDVDDPLRVVLDAGSGIYGPRFELDFILQGFVADPSVAFESDAVDDRIFDHSHGYNGSLAIQGYVREQIGCKQSLERIVKVFLIDDVALLESQI